MNEQGSEQGSEQGATLGSAQVDDGYARHRRTQTLMQEAIAEVADRARGADLPDVVLMVEEALVARGVPPQPARWLESVAIDAQQGRIYVEEPHLGAEQVLERYTDDSRE